MEDKSERIVIFEQLMLKFCCFIVNIIGYNKVGLSYLFSTMMDFFVHKYSIDYRLKRPTGGNKT